MLAMLGAGVLGTTWGGGGGVGEALSASSGFAGVSTVAEYGSPPPEDGIG